VKEQDVIYYFLPNTKMLSSLQNAESADALGVFYSHNQWVAIQEDSEWFSYITEENILQDFQLHCMCKEHFANVILSKGTSVKHINSTSSYAKFQISLFCFRNLNISF
jgi:hypothetical protein